VKRLTSEWRTKAKRDALTKLLKTLITDATKKGIQSENNHSNLSDSWQDCLNKDEDAIKSLEAVKSLSGSKRMSKYKKSLVGLAMYLFEVEGCFASYMNLVCLMLVYQGHDLYNFFDRNFARSLDEIASVNMQTKELFLKEHDFELFNEGFNRKLRNAIAHFDFEIAKDGTVRAKGIKYNVEHELQQLTEFMILVHEINASALKSNAKLQREPRQKS
jgi:hypothetical protein